MSTEALQEHAVSSAAASADVRAQPAPTSGDQAGQVAQRRPPRRRLWAFLRGLRTTLVVLVLLAAALGGGTYVARHRLAAQSYIGLTNAALTAQPVPVGSPSAGLVVGVFVVPQNQVTAGQALARVIVVGPDAKSHTQTLRAPVAGIVSTVDLTGGAATSGEPIVTLYDPAQLTFHAAVSIDQLRRLRLGMSAKITSPGLGRPISARLERVVPKVGGEAPSGQPFTVVFVPDQSQLGIVRTLVPGLPVTVTVDTRTMAGGTPAVNIVR